MTSTAVTGLDAVRERAAAALAERLREHLERLSWGPERLREHLERLDWGPDRLAAHQRARLRALLAHAIERSPFHAERLRGVDPERFEPADLAALPVMTKAEMMARFDEVVTDRRLSREAVEAHLAASVEEPSLLLDEYVCVASGGSSGERGVFVSTVAEFADTGASVLRPGVARLSAGDGLPPDGLVMAAVMAAAPIHVSGFASAVLTGPPVRLLSAPATLPLDELVERLNDLQPPALMGYPSKLVLLAREQRTGRLGIAPRVITSTSETLIPEDRDAIRAAFGAPVVDQFATTEGLVGHSAPDDSVLTFASDMCIAELVDADNQPVPEGTPSAKVLVTNLHNFTQPLIRYELTDRFVRHPGDGPLRATVEGRADEVFRYDSVEVHPHAIRTELVMAPAVREYQVHQTERGAHVAVVADGELDPDALATAIARNLRRAGVPDPHVTVRRVDAVPCHPQTGKVTRFIALTRR